MNLGKTLFAQLMDFLPWKTFHRIVDRHDGDRYVKSMTCAEQFRVMAFAQLTYRESLRDIEVCLSAQSAKLYHMGFRQEIKRSTLADANEARDWRVHAAFAQHLIGQARKLYTGDSLGFELENTAYALDSTTIDLSLSLFPWAPFRTTKAAVKMHTLLDLRGSIAQQARESARDQAELESRLKQTITQTVQQLRLAQAALAQNARRLRLVELRLEGLRSLALPTSPAQARENLEQLLALDEQRSGLVVERGRLEALFWLLDETHWNQTLPPIRS